MKRISAVKVTNARPHARFAGEPQEVVVALLLDSRNRVFHTALLSRGTVDRAAAFPREVAKVALESSSCGEMNGVLKAS